MADSKVEAWLKYGVATALDLPTEGVTPSDYPPPASGNKTEQNAPVEQTPNINNGGGLSLGGNVTMYVIAGLGFLALAKAFKVI